MTSPESERKPAAATESAMTRARHALGRIAPLIALALIATNGWWFYTRIQDTPRPSATSATAAPRASGTSSSATPRLPRTRPATSQPAAPQTRQVVPQVLGLTATEAQQALSAANLRPGRREWAVSDQARNTVLASSPEPGSRVDRQQTVDLTLSAGPLQTVPVVDVALTDTPAGLSFSASRLNAQPGSLLIVSNHASNDCTATGTVPPSESGSPVMRAGMKAVFYLMVVATYEISCESSATTVTVIVDG